VLAILSLAFGTPVIQGFGRAHEKWGILLTYTSISEQSWDGAGGWLYYAASIPIYLLIWDFFFYILHLALHMEPIYSYSHANHHAFRPPVAWSGIAIDPIEQFFSGIGPYVIPLFIAPFHLYTVYAINVCLMGWALYLHSAAPHKGGWLFMAPAYHNKHHEMGINNGNYGAIFKIYDRIFGTLREDKLAFWAEAEFQAAEAALEKKNPSTSSSKRAPRAKAIKSQ
jgi:sterol desaturase/sphingolipid hydroxylase (fatty acid hydroxylase superfamily)